MIAPLEVVLHHPVEIGGTVHDKLTLRADANARGKRGDVRIRLAQHFGVSPAVIDELDLVDLQRLSEMVAQLES